jgi:RHS repeat-associated protein
VLADPPHLSQHQRTPSPPPLSSSCSSYRNPKLKTSNPCNHRNQQYSIIGLTNASGTLVERYTYTAYGTLGIYDASGTVRTTSTYANRYTYTGREYDADLALFHFRARWYDPSTGGFISRDPLGYVDGMSLYRGYFGVEGVDFDGRMKRSNFRTKKIGDPCNGGNVGHQWDWEFEHIHRDKTRTFPGHQHGWVIQRIEAICIDCECDADCNCTNCTESKPVVYYEAWYFGEFSDNVRGIRSREARNVGRTTLGGTDTHYGPGLTEKGCKKMKMKGEARILLQKDRVKPSYRLIDGAPGWQKRSKETEFVHAEGDCRLTAGNLHNYIPKGEPPQWAQAGLKVNTDDEAPVSYEYETELNCCGSEFKFHGSGDFPTDLDFYKNDAVDGKLGGFEN